MQEALAELDMEAIFLVSAGERWHKLVSGKDPRNAFTNARRENRDVTGISLTLYADNEVVTQRLIAQTLKRLEIDQVRTDRRWVGCEAERVERVLYALSAWLGVKLLTPGERLQRGIQRAEARAKRAGIA